MTALRRLLNVSLLVSVRAGSPIFDAFARMHAEFLGGWLLVAVLALLRLRNTAALATAVLLIWLAYSSSQAVNWSYIDAPSMLALVAAGLETAALLASPGPARAVQIMNWKHYVLALAIPLGLAATLNWAGLDHPSITSSIMITVCALTLSGMALASPLGKRVAALLALPVYYLIVELLVPPSMTGGPTTPHRGGRGRCGSR